MELATRPRLTVPPFPFNDKKALDGLALYIPFWNEKLRTTVVSFDNKHHTSTLTGTSYVQNTGRLFDNVDDKLVIPHNAVLNAVGQCTLIAWIRPTNTWENLGGSHQIIDKRSDAGGVAPTLLGGNDGKIAIFAGTTCALGTTTSFAAGTWFMMAGKVIDGVVGGATNKIWVDGVDDTASTDTATFVTNTVPLVIGAAFSDPTYINFLDADYGELWFYPTRGFTDAEILAFFRETNKRGQYK